MTHHLCVDDVAVRERVKPAASDWTGEFPCSAPDRSSPDAPRQTWRTHPTLAAPIAIKTGTIAFLLLTSPMSPPTLCPPDEWAGWVVRTAAVEVRVRRATAERRIEAVAGERSMAARFWRSVFEKWRGKEQVEEQPKG